MKNTSWAKTSPTTYFRPTGFRGFGEPVVLVRVHGHFRIMGGW